MWTIRTMITTAGFPQISLLKNCVALNKEKDVGLIQASIVNEDDKDDEYDSRIFTDRNTHNLRRIKQRKGLCFIQVVSDDEDDQDDEYDSRIFTDRNAQNLRRIKQRKGHCFIHV